MATRDLISGIKMVQAVGPATYSADVNGAWIDTLGYDSVAIAISVGAGGITFDPTNRLDIRIESSDDGSTSNGGVAQGDIQSYQSSVTVGSNGIVKSFTAAHPNPDVTKVGYIGNSRYIRVVPDFSGTHGTGTPVSGMVILGRAHLAPTA